MTSIPDRPNTALLIVDVQHDVVANAHERDRVIANIGTVLQRARDAGTPVIWVQHADEELKHFGDSFEETDLEERLAERKVGHLVVTGAQTDACIRATLHGALVRGYDATLVEDAHTTDDPSQWGAPLDASQVIAHTNLYWKWEASAGRSGGTVSTAEVAFSPS